jgi:hypothetical protein
MKHLKRIQKQFGKYLSNSGDTYVKIKTMVETDADSKTTSQIRLPLTLSRTMAISETNYKKVNIKVLNLTTTRPHVSSPLDLILTIFKTTTSQKVKKSYSVE